MEFGGKNMSRDDDDLLALLGAADDEKEVQAQVNGVYIPEKIVMTQGTRAKAQAICDAVRTIGERPYEWFSFLLASRADQEFIVRDLHLVKGAQVQPSHVSVDGTMHARAAAEILEYNREHGTDYYTIGWLHSHGAGMVGHSGEDDRNFEQLLNSVRLNTQQAVLEPLRLIETAERREIKDGALVISGQQVEDAVFRYATPNTRALEEVLERYGLTALAGFREVPEGQFLADLLRVVDVTVQQAKIVGFGYSVVVNDKNDDPHALIGYVEEHAITAPGKLHMKTKQTRVACVDVDDDVTFDQRELEALVRERLQFPPKYVPRLVRGKRGGRAPIWSMMGGDPYSTSPEDIMARYTGPYTHPPFSVQSTGTQGGHTFAGA